MSSINMVRKEGGSRVISISKIIPADWLVVELTTLKASDKVITLKIEKVK